MTYLEQHTATQDSVFVGRVKQALIKASMDIANEAPETANHANRIRLCNAALLDPEAWAREMSCAVAANWAITSADAADTDIYNAVAAAWDAYANALAAQG